MNSGKLGPTVTTNMVLEKRLKYASPTEEEIVRSVDSDTPTASEDQDARFMYDGSETPRDGKVSRLEQDAGRSQPPGARRVHDNTKKHGGLPNDPDCLMDATDGKPPQSGNATGKQTDTDILERDRGGAGGGGAPPPKIPIVMVTGVSTGGSHTSDTDTGERARLISVAGRASADSGGDSYGVGERSALTPAKAQAPHGRRVRIHGVTTASSADQSVTPVDNDGNPRRMATESSVGFEEEDGHNGALLNHNRADMEGDEAEERPTKRALLGTQGPLMELSSVIANPGMKRAESLEILNLTLHQCARDGDVENMPRLLSSLTGNVKKKVNAHDDSDLSALHYAARYNHVLIVQMLVQGGANVNDEGEEGGTPLHFAARYKRMRLGTQAPGESNTDPNANTENEEPGDEEKEEDTEDTVDAISTGIESTPENSVILYLHSQKADVNVKDIYGCTPLHFAAMRGNEVATKELLSVKGINIEAVDKQQMTPLHLAASHDEKEVVRMLIEKGANLRCCDEDMGTPLHFACMEGSLDVVNMLFNAAELTDGWVTMSEMVNDQDNQQNSALHLAVENRALEVAELCIAKGADVNTPRNNYMTPLHLAAVAGELEIVKLLIAHSARVNALDITQQTPLHCAAEYDHADVVEYLLGKGAKINRHDKDNYSPLLLAAVEGNAKTIETLLRCGANLYDVDKADKTALFLAAESDKLEALQVLLSNPRTKGLLDASDRYDNTPLHVAAQNGFLACVKALLDAGTPIDSKNEEESTAVHLAATNGKTNIVRELVRRNKTVVNDEDEDSNTALHLAALAGHNKVVKELIDAGADIEARNCTLWTPLDCAAAKGWSKVAKTLLEADAPVDPMDKSRTTPLHLSCSRGHVAVVNVLLQWQASVSQRDTDGKNCLDLAIDSGHKDVVMTIINSNSWREALMNEDIHMKTGLRVTPMRRLIRKMPDAAERVFNRCTTSNMNNPDHPDYAITFNYEFLDDMYANWRETSSSDTMSTSDSIFDDENHLVDKAKPYSSNSDVLKKNHPMMIMVQTNQEDLLAHPLVTSLLRHKWSSYGRYFYYTNFFIYCIFLAFLTGYILVHRPVYFFRDRLNTTVTGLSLCEQIRLITKLPKDTVHPVVFYIFGIIGKYIVMALAALNLLREMFQIYNSRLNYVRMENLIEWIIYIFALLLVIDFNPCQQETGIKHKWQWDLGALCIFLAWIELVLFIRKLPRFGIYVVMFTDIFRTFVSFSPVFFLFILAFALSFYTLFQNQYEFSNVGYALIKTSVMMIGEFEFANLFLGEEDNPGIYSHMVYHEVVSYLIFIAFLVIMSILIMNLLVGLAVDDIKAVQEQAVLKRLAMQVELALDVEAIIPHFIRRKFVMRARTIKPNRRHGCYGSCTEFESSVLSSSAINKALNPDLVVKMTGRLYDFTPITDSRLSQYEMGTRKDEGDEMEQLQDNQEKMMTQINNLRGKLKSMGQNQETLQAMVTALLKHHKVEWQDEDFQAEE